MDWKKINKKIFVGLIGALVLFGCAVPQTKTGKGSMYGAAGGAVIGAILGQAIGHDTEGTLLGAAAGAAVGAATGAGVGHMMDQMEAEMRNALAASQAATVKRENDILSITFNSDITFGVNEDTILPGFQTELNRIAHIMSKYPQTTVTIAGHTDNTGSYIHNQELSKRRSANVKQAMVQMGVDALRITAVGYGQSCPVATNNTPEGRQKNRRVEIRINSD